MKGSTEGARSPSNMAAMCSQQAGSFIALPVQRIEQVVQPTAQQQRQRRRWATNASFVPAVAAGASGAYFNATNCSRLRAAR